jgi:hypothetical protein
MINVEIYRGDDWSSAVHFGQFSLPAAPGTGQRFDLCEDGECAAYEVVSVRWEAYLDRPEFNGLSILIAARDDWPRMPSKS